LTYLKIYGFDDNITEISSLAECKKLEVFKMGSSNLLSDNILKFIKNGPTTIKKLFFEFEIQDADVNVNVIFKKVILSAIRQFTKLKEFSITCHRVEDFEQDFFEIVKEIGDRDYILRIPCISEEALSIFNILFRHLKLESL